MIQIKTGRDYTTKFETREENDKKYIEGYFVRFDDKYHINAKAYETIDPQAFRNMGQHDIACLWNHNTDLPLGNTSNGTAQFRVDSGGVWGCVEINEDDPQAVGAYARIKRGDVRGCSFGFSIDDEKILTNEDGMTEFRLMLVDPHEFSPCTFPAYKSTTMAAREKQLEDMQKRSRQAQIEQMKVRFNKIAENSKTD